MKVGQIDHYRTFSGFDSQFKNLKRLTSTNILKQFDASWLPGFEFKA